MDLDRAKEFVGENRAEAVDKARSHFGVGEERLELRIVSQQLEIAGLGDRVMVLAALKSAQGVRAEPRRDSRREPRRDSQREPRRDSRREPSREPRAEPVSGPPGELGLIGRFTDELVRKMELGGPTRVDETESDGRVLVTLSGDAIQQRARRDSRLAGSLSHLVGRAAESLLDEEARVRVEIAGVRGEEPRSPVEAELEALARSKAEEVCDSGEPVVLQEMNSKERWVVHNAIKDVAGVTSESVGEGRNKRVKIMPR